jgi:hypothetical protein
MLSSLLRFIRLPLRWWSSIHNLVETNCSGLRQGFGRRLVLLENIMDEPRQP